MQDRDQGDKVLSEAIDAFGASVYRFAYSQLRSHQNAEDIYQEVFSALYVSAIRFEDSYHLKSWLMKVTVNRCKNLKCKIANGRETSTDFTNPDSPLAQTLHTEESDFNNEQTGLVWEIVDRLSEDFRAVIHLHYVERYSTDEIAAITDTTPATVRTRLFRARHKIKQALKGGAANGLL